MEITARDLRIGNYVNYRIQDDLDERKDWFECSKIDANDLVVLESGIDYNYQPIPITEDWLLKFGFVNLQKEADNNGGLVELIHNNVIGYRFAPEGAYGHTEIKYVHQLQNLYYALTQTELTLTK